jgi:hypothetical protein
MARLLTVVEEAVASVAPPDPLDYFDPFKTFSGLDPGDRCLLFLGMDAGRTSENSVPGMIAWFGEFQRRLGTIPLAPDRFAATVFVLDWPPDQKPHPVALRDEREIGRLMAAGLCYRPKEEPFYAPGRGGLARSLRDDLRAKRLIPDQDVLELDEAFEPRAALDPDDPRFREALEYLGDPHMTWPPDVIRDLLRR